MISHRVYPIAAAALALAAMLAYPAGAATEKEAAPEKPIPGASPIGNYLAGRHAQATRDMQAALTYLNAALFAMPDAPDLRRRTFILQVIEGNIKAALPLAKELLAENPKAPIAGLVLGVDALMRSDLKAIKKRMEQGAERGLNSFTGPLLTAWGLADAKDKKGALAALAPLAANEATKGLHEVHRAFLLDFFDDPEAGVAYDSVVKGNLGGSFRIVQHMGEYYERHGQPDKSRAIYDKLREDLPGTTLLEGVDARLKAGKKPKKLLRSARDGAAEALFSIANSLRRQQARETALVLVRLALHLRPDFAMALILTADILEDDHRPAEANAIYAKVDPASPFRLPADLSRARNLDTLKETDAAIAIYNEIAKRRPTDAEPATQLGNLYRRHERWPEAIAAYSDAFKRIGTLEQRHWRLLYARGIAYERAKRWADAELDFIKALEFEPEQPFVLNYLGYSWIDQGLNLDRAQDMIRRAVKLRPKDGFIVDSLGWGYYRVGKYAEAVTELERAVEIRPQDPVINDHLGDAYWRVGRKLEARFQWHRALSLNPDKEVEARVREKLEKGLGAPDPLPASAKEAPEKAPAPPAPALKKT
jgi:tetratricopeptide (TPR) repeat protein